LGGAPRMLGQALFGLIGYCGAAACSGWLRWTIWRSGGGR